MRNISNALLLPTMLGIVVIAVGVFLGALLAPSPAEAGGSCPDTSCNYELHCLNDTNDAMCQSKRTLKAFYCESIVCD